EMEILKTENNVVAFNVYKCPAAEFFKEHKLSELCVKSWCNLDYPLAEKWKVKLERTKTIAKGNELCNFRFVE
ncbi:MAG: L-2-amino-thiazoline-4-carboxylic acid hydrolase, partial [Spirochaetes bacterium]|nr:L-2-amino-thiazoline-4-carboxylic acid hydrolase [Spirochaetota bacterium]